MSVSENAAYLKGLFDGYELSDTKENKIIAKLLDLVSDMADEINALKADNKELHEYVEELDHDLGEVEEEVYFVDEDDYDELPQVKSEGAKKKDSQGSIDAPEIKD